MEKDDIKKLVLQAAQGNKAAFGALYEETGRTVWLCRYLHNLSYADSLLTMPDIGSGISKISAYGRLCRYRHNLPYVSINPYDLSIT